MSTFCGLLVGLLLLSAHDLRAQTAERFQSRTIAKDSHALRYRLFVPQDYDASKSYPVILYLHGAGERGRDDTMHLVRSAEILHRFVSDSVQLRHPCFVVAPQCPWPEQWVAWDWTLGSYSTDAIGEHWPLTLALESLELLQKEFSLDSTRVYVVGLSMGGYGVWDALVRHPEKFAGAIAVCGGGDTSKAQIIRSIPVWAFHGTNDDVVPVKASREMVRALENVGSNIQYIEYPGVSHISWPLVAREPALADWLFAQVRTQAAVHPPLAANELRYTGGRLLIPAGVLRIELYSVLGQLVERIDVESAQVREVTLRSDLTIGPLFVQVTLATGKKVTLRLMLD